MSKLVIIALQIEGKPSDASYVVDELLDTGILQDAINGHTFDAAPLRVKVAVRRTLDKVALDRAHAAMRTALAQHGGHCDAVMLAAITAALDAEGE